MSVVLLVSSRGAISILGSPALGIDTAKINITTRNTTHIRKRESSPYDFVGRLVVFSENSHFLELLVTFFELSFWIGVGA